MEGFFFFFFSCSPKGAMEGFEPRSEKIDLSTKSIDKLEDPPGAGGPEEVAQGSWEEMGRPELGQRVQARELERPGDED